MFDQFDVTCPCCATAFEAEAGSLVCPSCDWDFEVDPLGEVTEGDLQDREGLWEVNDDGEWVADAPETAGCPRCSRPVELAESGALSGWCVRCHRTFLVRQPYDFRRVEESYDDEWCEDLLLPWEEELACPNCGGEHGDYGDDDYDVLAVWPGGSRVRCGCGWEYEVATELEVGPSEPDEEEEVAEGPRRTIVVSPAGKNHTRTLREALQRASDGDRVLVRPGYYEESLTLYNNLEIIGDGPPEDVILCGKHGPCLINHARRATVRGLTLWGLAGMGGRPAEAVEVVRGRLLLAQCSVTSDSGPCVRARGYTTEVVLRCCRLHDGTGGGIAVEEGARATLEDGAVEANAAAGVDVRGGEVVLRRCRVSGGPAEGVCVSGGTVKAVDCEIAENAGPGVVVSGGRAELRDCDVRSNGTAGILIEERGHCTVEGGTLAGNAGAGVRLMHRCNLVMRGCEVSGNATGVEARGRALVEDSRVSGNAGRGVAVIGGKLCLSGCRLSDNAVGVAVTDGVLWMEGCEVSGGKAGVGARGGHMVIQRCRVRGASRAGLLLRPGTFALAEDCDVCGNGGAGVEVRGGGPLVRGCRVRDNRLAGVWVHGRGSACVEDCDLAGNGRGPCEVESGCVVRVSGNQRV